MHTRYTILLSQSHQRTNSEVSELAWEDMSRQTRIDTELNIDFETNQRSTVIGRLATTLCIVAIACLTGTLIEDDGGYMLDMHGSSSPSASTTLLLCGEEKNELFRARRTRSLSLWIRVFLPMSSAMHILPK